MAIALKFLGGATLTGTLTTIYTAPSSTTTRLEHLIISNGPIAGSVTIVFNDGMTNFELLNAVPLAPNGVLELANLILESGNSIRASATTTGAKITLFGQEQT